MMSQTIGNVNLYNKNPRYDKGGILNGDNIYLIGNTKVKADKKSTKTIKNRIKGKLPNLKEYKWYKNIQKTPYKKLIKQIEVKYAQ
jgi:hypothetical protein